MRYLRGQRELLYSRSLHLLTHTDRCNFHTTGIIKVTHEVLRGVLTGHAKYCRLLSLQQTKINPDISFSGFRMHLQKATRGCAAPVFPSTATDVDSYLGRGRIKF